MTAAVNSVVRSGSDRTKSMISTAVSRTTGMDERRISASPSPIGMPSRTTDENRNRVRDSPPH